MIDSIIFDLDGTLWDTRKETYNSVNEIIKKYDLDYVSEDLIKSSMGHNNSEIAEMYMPGLEKEYREKLFDEMEQDLVKFLNSHGGILYKGVKETLEILSKNYKLFIVSNCGAGYIESFLDYYKLNNYFTDFIAASKEQITKSVAIKRLEDKYNLNKPIYVGDTYGDFEQAKKAKVMFIHARYGFCNNLRCDIYIDSIEELILLLEKLN